MHRYKSSELAGLVARLESTADTYERTKSRRDTHRAMVETPSPKRDPRCDVDRRDELPPDHPLYSPQEDVFTARCNDVYRAGAMSHDDGTITLVMQHLQISEPPYTRATCPGRMITMTFEEFSRYVDAVVSMRDKMKASKP